jgi:hypothetical protein
MSNLPVNPAKIQKGDQIATSSYTDDFGNIIVTRSHKVQRVSFCKIKPEMFHIDGACYDTRFSTIIRVN